MKKSPLCWVDDDDARDPTCALRSALLGQGTLAAGAAWGMWALSLREEEEEGGAWRRLGAAGGGWQQGVRAAEEEATG